jgi:hypothetical protein
MRNRIAYKIIHAGYFKSAEKTMDLVVEFCGTFEPQQIISINLLQDGRAVVWYRER